MYNTLFIKLIYKKFHSWKVYFNYAKEYKPVFCPSTGNARAKKWEWVGRGAGWGKGIGDICDSIWNANEENIKKKRKKEMLYSQ